MPVVKDHVGEGAGRTRGLNIAHLISRVKYGSKYASGIGIKPLPDLPTEILQHIATFSGWSGFLNLRQTNRKIHEALMYKFMSEVGHHARIYPRYDSIYPYIEFLKRHFAMRHLIRRITLVGDALCLPEHGYAWTWEQLALNMLEDPCFSEEDQQVMVAVGKLHYPHARRDLRFIYTGIFRLMLTQALMMLPNLSEIIIGKLKPGEHIPGWQGDELMKQVSFYGHKGFNLSTMFYGDYQYDEIHQVANTYVDEYGMVVEPEEPGPQATFLDDFDAARTAAGIDLRIVRLHGYCSYYRLSKPFHRVVKYRCTYAECSFCVERYDIEQDPFLDLDANLFKY